MAAPWLALLAGAIVVLMGVVAFVQWRQSSLMSEATLASGDNLAHFLYQADNEYLRLRESWPRDADTLQAQGAQALQLRYDIFVSRIEVLRNAMKGRAAGSNPEVVDALRQAEAFIATADQALGPGRAPPDATTLLALRGPLLGLDGALRGLSLEASKIVSAYATRVSEASRTHNRLGLGLSLVMAVMALAFGVYAWKQLQRLELRRLQLETLAMELRDARAAAEAASASKSSFLANMSHEIRTPFQGLKGMLGLLGSTALDARQLGYLRTASASADHLLTLLNDILDMSRLESGRMTLEPVPVVLRELLDEVEALMRPQAQLKGLAFEALVEEVVPQRLELDPTRVRQVLFNLLANAIKFTQQGQVRLEVRRRDDVGGRGGGPGDAGPRIAQLEFAIMDTGMGMDEATLARLFQRFSQGDESMSRRFGGTGLGLEISRSLARLMGGDVHVTSQLGQGSTFTLAVPLPVLTEEPAPAKPQAMDRGWAGRSLRVMVAEDNEVNRMVMEAILGGMGHAVGFAENGEQAVSLALEQAWDIVLMDLHMPVMDGLDATRAIRRAQHPQRSRVPIVALTADVFPETRARCESAGVQDFLTKPVDTAELAACLRRLVPGAEAAG